MQNLQRHNEHFALGLSEAQTQVSQISQTVYQNAEVLDRLKCQLYEQLNQMKQQLGSEIVIHADEMEKVKTTLEKVKKWSMDLDDQFREYLETSPGDYQEGSFWHVAYATVF